MTALEVQELPDLAAVISSAADGVIEVLDRARRGEGLYDDGMARIVLTGGGAGIGTLEELQRRGTDRSGAHFFFGDERNVAPDHPDSNEGQARRALFDAANVPEANIHGYGLGSVDMATAAQDYEEVLAQFAPQGFDLHLLGMGGEGHINSLFPHSYATKEQERLVVAVEDSPKPPAQRVTLTLPAVATADHVWLLVAGEEKAEAVAQLRAGAPAEELPAAGARGRKSTVLKVAANAL
ncbi:6-phosphogluconolactonase [Corynebacterium pelargi]|uniref:6-phosphogluconolactonase n=1 Tax=Corynebacterium pelargi TaxID=1471400 RepID=A0A410W8Q9_9CORY|nr:6-phosphogluconolactonase [Corynebacterium pelargi]QAU52328.1 6-phosphogluconolactonase [Corynebacterium pelargi]GGG68448.1 6-phosphogluconolactonase [Corynebacterium pelargi]